MARIDGRKVNELRKIKVTKNYIKHPEGCCLIEFGATKVICAASFEESVPPFLKGSGKGWVTAEYGMLPRSCNSRIKRNLTSGRTQEIQRLIGRSLRSVVDMTKLGENTVKIDCDVIQADGGTRTAAITGGFIALALALKKKKKQDVIKDYVAAVSVGILDKAILLDLKYEEDCRADIDMNIVMVKGGEFVEIQGTAEGKTFNKKQMDQMLSLAHKGIRELFKVQQKALNLEKG